jgi:hypothetical protein
MVVPVSIEVMKELYNMTDLLRMCEEPSDFVEMADVLKE